MSPTTPATLPPLGRPVHRLAPRPAILATAALIALVLALTGCTSSVNDTTTSAVPPSTGAATTTAPSTDTTGATTTDSGRDVGGPLPALEQVTGEAVFSAGYGDGPAQFGYEAGQEAVTVGPRALWVAPDGTLSILDPKHDAVQVVDPAGKVTRTVTLKAKDPRDIAVALDGTLLVDDTDGTAELQAYGADGALETSVPSTWDGISSFRLVDDGQTVYAVVAAPDGTLAYVAAYADGALQTLSDGYDAGAVAHPLSDGWQAAETWTDGLPALTITGPGGESFTVEPPVESPEDAHVAPIDLVARTAKGNILVSAGVGRGEQLTRLIWLYDSQGRLLRQIETPFEESTADAFAPRIRSTPDGAVYTLVVDANGLKVLRLPVE